MSENVTYLKDGEQFEVAGNLYTLHFHYEECGQHSDSFHVTDASGEWCDEVDWEGDMVTVKDVTEILRLNEPEPTVEAEEEPASEIVQRAEGSGTICLYPNGAEVFVPKGTDIQSVLDVVDLSLKEKTREHYLTVVEGVTWILHPDWEQSTASADGYADVFMEGGLSISGMYKRLLNDEREELDDDDW